MVKFGIGQAIKRVEDQRLLTGQGNYTDDVAPDGALRAFILRSPYAHAKIKSVETADAEAVPGVVAVLTNKHVQEDGLGDLPSLAPAPNKDGSPRADTPRPILEGDKVRHVGTPVALVIAETLEAARDAAELVEIDYEPLGAATDAEEATKPGAAQLYDHIPNNICFDWHKGDLEINNAAFTRAAKVVETRVVNNRIIVNSMEPRGAIGLYDAETDRTTLYSSTQGPSFIHPHLAETVLKIDKSKLRCLTTDVGGGFGMKIFLYPEQCLIAWASRRLKRTVKYTPERSEAFMADTQGRDNISYVTSALDENGKIIAMKVETFANLGGYLSNFAAFIPTEAGTHMLSGVYDIPSIYVNVKGVVTNTTPTDAYRGAGRPEAAYLIERVMDNCAAETGLTRDEIRRRNYIAPEQMPYSTTLGNVYDTGEFQTVMEKCMERADWSGFPTRKAESEKRGKLRGIGLGYYIEKCGGGNPETADIRFTEDDKIEIYIGNQSNGQGHETAYAQVLGDVLGIDGERIKIVQGDTDRTPPGLTGGSRALPVGGVAVLLGGREIVEKGKKVAGRVMEAAIEDIEFADGTFTVAGTDKTMSLFDVNRAAEGEEEALDTVHQRTPEAATFPNGCHVCELEIDPDTGIVEIQKYTVVDDFGSVINPNMLAGQVHGGVGQGLGQALYERTVYDEESGQLVTGSYMDYHLPRADQVPWIDFTTHNVWCKTNPLGIKGSGEAGAIGAPPAAISAVCDALGVVNIDMPATPEKIWAVANEGRLAAAE
ncbi:xanthine dehydrogenase family protein molybdopterin-binding subunit [Nisaea acidiphila]|uniref:Xanthine dehydrogenase family protein molybdopterin-binding subunit n=1 Tax=Nisaea acidiphila TaxID=1862145 RepID=A0A9J7AS89_9PROT|nr:xanthine dehydrogenase family protein molybdopterin-binding subunit [Nisaea acidiphila]UUX49196.1 xanthine dehydrogenase family protein molybdopterin-binding subunit [Nisaea acidiphila]